MSYIALKCDVCASHCHPPPSLLLLFSNPSPLALPPPLPHSPFLPASLLPSPHSLLTPLTKALTNVSSVAVKEAPWPCESMAQIASLLLEYHANPDSQDSTGFTPLQRAIECRNEEVFNVLLNNQMWVPLDLASFWISMP